MKKLIPLLATLFIFTACSIEPNKAQEKKTIKKRQGIPEIISMTIKNKDPEPTQTGYHLFKGEYILLQPQSFTWEKRDRGEQTIIATNTWSGCNSFRTSCWNKNSETFSKEYSPAIIAEVVEPITHVQSFLESILFDFYFKSGRKITCSASQLVYEKTNKDALLQIENTPGCPLYADESDEIINFSLQNKINLGDIHYTAGTYLRSDDGDQNSYQEATYNPEIIVNLQLTIK